MFMLCAYRLRYRVTHSDFAGDERNDVRNFFSTDMLVALLRGITCMYVLGRERTQVFGFPH